MKGIWAIPILASILILGVFGISLSESANFADAIDTSPTKQISLTESLTLTDQVNTEAAFTITLRESLTIADKVITD